MKSVRVITVIIQIEGIVCHFRKYAYLLFC